MKTNGYEDEAQLIGDAAELTFGDGQGKIKDANGQKRIYIQAQTPRGPAPRPGRVVDQAS